MMQQQPMFQQQACQSVLNCLSDLVPDVFFPDLGPEMGSRRPGRCLKRLLVAVGFTLTDYGPVGSHGDPIRGRKYGFGTAGMCCVETADMCCVEAADMCCVETTDMCCVETTDMCCVETADMCLALPCLCVVCFVMRFL